MTAMKLGTRGDALIRGKEALRLTAFLPTARDVPTIGWGHTSGVKLGDACTAEQAEAWYREDTADAVAAVNSLGVPLSQAMFDALVSLVYNEGAGAISPRSSVGSALRERSYFAAWRGFCLWTKQAGHDLRGLAVRRSAEMGLFMGDSFPEA